MPSLPALLKKLEALHRQHAQTEYEIAEVKRQIIATGKSGPSRRRKRVTPAESVEVVRATVKVLRDAGEPLPRREIAARLGLAPHAVYYRVQKAIKAGFVERVSGGRYRATNVVPAF